jgi:hypothetical protein
LTPTGHVALFHAKHFLDLIFLVFGSRVGRAENGQDPVDLVLRRRGRNFDLDS